jgi:hypothetical protein
MLSFNIYNGPQKNQGSYATQWLLNSINDPQVLIQHDGY